jgi:hypothetical protein
LIAAESVALRRYFRRRRPRISSAARTEARRALPLAGDDLGTLITYDDWMVDPLTVRAEIELVGDRLLDAVVVPALCLAVST